MDLIIDNCVIHASIKDILDKINHLVPTKGLFKQVEDKGDYFRITCPKHKDGHEDKASCSIYNRTDNDSIVWGTVHCFTCGYKAQLYQFVAFCLDIEIDEAKRWLIDNFSDTYIEVSDTLFDPIDIFSDKPKQTFLNESTLEQYKYFHPYMFERNLTEDIIKRFLIGYDHGSDSITFPVWDENNNLVAINRRSVKGKSFQLQTGIDKPVYLLNFVLKDKYNYVVVTEGQFDALTSWSYGVPAVSLFGCGTTDHQMDILNKSGIYHFILMYDNDEAGRKGAERFKSKISKDRLVTDIIMPRDRDVGSCTKDEFFTILRNNNLGFLI